MSELYLYHATDRKNLDSIKEHGLLIHPPSHAYASFGEDCLNNKIFLAFDTDAAEAYAECSDDEPEDIVILKIKLDALNYHNFDYDWNNRCEYRREINSCVYKANIPPELIEVCTNTSNEPFQDLFTFERTELFYIIDCIFYEECATNLEDEE